MSKMYKPDPNKPKVAVPAQNNQVTVQELQDKLRQLTEKHNNLQADFDRLSRSVKRQGNDVNNIFGRINRTK
jgi:peptidoglycan hydrolase CwlO-like protein